jgi:hypothetical protein
MVFEYVSNALTAGDSSAVFFGVPVHIVRCDSQIKIIGSVSGPLTIIKKYCEKDDAITAAQK